MLTKLLESLAARLIRSRPPGLRPVMRDEFDSAVAALREQLRVQAGRTSEAEEAEARLALAAADVQKMVDHAAGQMAENMRAQVAGMIGQLQTTAAAAAPEDDRFLELYLRSKTDLVMGMALMPGQPDPVAAQGNLTAIAVMQAGLQARSLRLSRPAEPPPPRHPAKPVPYEESLAFLRKLDPETFQTWFRLYQNGEAAYRITKVGNCAHRGSWYSRVFSCYLELFARGHILDIGCGAWGVPQYLEHFDRRQIAGLEPLPLLAEADFEVQRGFNELVPWPDATFDTVVNCTSLDHVIDIERSLDETIRVLKPGGRFILYIASIPGQPAYTSRRPGILAIDDYHLFHFDREWIEPMLETRFQVLDVTILPQPGFDHVLYCLKPKR
jgi:SAM-dependent methyltransferase